MSSSAAATVAAPLTSSIVEGKARIACSENEKVFYNNVQILNRDLSIQVINLFAETRQAEKDAAYAKKLDKYNSLLAGDGSKPETLKPPRQLAPGITVLDALAATGLRSVRYLKEIRGVRQVSVNDIDPKATASIVSNLLANGIPRDQISVEAPGDPAAPTTLLDADTAAAAPAPRVRVHTGDGALLMYGHRDPLAQYDVIDLDPYGSCAPFLDAAVQSVSHGGLLCVTCTDMSVFCGNYPEKCFTLYGAVPLKAKYTHVSCLSLLCPALRCALVCQFVHLL
jgi:tRNA (guanine26-N2/guanine27-N2)-dimethyltransferase